MARLRVILGVNDNNGTVVQGTQRGSFNMSPFPGTTYEFFIIEEDTSSNSRKLRIDHESSITIPDPPDMQTAVSTAVAAAVGAMPAPPSPAAIATAIGDAVEAAIDSVPLPPSPADIAAAISTAVSSARFPALPIQATLLGDDKHPVTATVNTPDIRSIGADVNATVGGGLQPVVATINVPDMKSIGIGGTALPIQLNPVDLSFAFRWDSMPTGKLKFKLPSLWFAFTLFTWKIFGFKVEVEGNLEVQADTPEV